jgi:hypothetical protein
VRHVGKSGYRSQRFRRNLTRGDPVRHRLSRQRQDAPLGHAPRSGGVIRARHRHFRGKLGLFSMREISAYRSSGVCSKRRRFACGRRRWRARGRSLPSITATAASAAASPLERALSFKRSFPASSHRRTISSSDNRRATGYAESSPNDHSSSAIVHLSVSTRVTPGSRPNASRRTPSPRLNTTRVPRAIRCNSGRPLRARERDQRILRRSMRGRPWTASADHSQTGPIPAHTRNEPPIRRLSCAAIALVDSSRRPDSNRGPLHYE